MMISPLRLARNFFLFLIVGLLALLLPALPLEAGNPVGPDAETVAADPNVHAVASADTDFCFRLLTQLNQATPKKNIFFSPFSISTCLTMVLNGANGQTQRDMAGALSLSNIPLAQVNEANAHLLPSLEDPKSGAQISVANALWANTGTHFDPDFQQRCHTFYDASTETIDFSSPTAADTINHWVSEKTQGKIDRLLVPGDLNQATAVLTNAVYFKGVWSEPFHKEDTHDGSFTLASGKKKTISMMSRNISAKYLETPQFQAASLPYLGDRLCMDIFLPKPGTRIDQFLRGLNSTTWAQWIAQMKRMPFTLTLPRFKAEETTSLNAPLVALGMGSAFGHQADFSSMGSPRAAISKVVHKAIVQVDERGTVAAGATATVMTLGLEMPPKFAMRVDHPFFMAIRDTTTGTILFAGVIRDPK